MDLRDLDRAITGNYGEDQFKNELDVRLLLGDCVTLMKTLPSDSIDLTVTSPPYDNLRKYNGYSFDFENTAKELFRLTKPGGVVVWVVADATQEGSETGTSFRQALFFKDCGFNLHDTMIYAKNSYMPKTHNRYEQAWEFMFVLSKGRPSVFNPIMVDCQTAGTKRNRGAAKQLEASYSERKRDELTTVNAKKQHPNIFYYDVGKNDKTAHNAPFPEKLAEDHILSWSSERDMVFDPFLGSGTTGKMAVLNNRNFIGCEISEEYLRIAEERIDAISG